VTRIVALLLVVGWPLAVHASGDGGCYPSWTLEGRELDACSGMPFFSPRNDNRINMMLLMADRGGAPLTLQPAWNGEYEDASVPFDVGSLVGWGWETPEAEEPAPPKLLALAAQIGVSLEGDELQFADGEGSRCRSNDFDTAEQFLAALIADPALSADERKALAQSRIAMLGACSWSDEARRQIAPAGISSPHGQQLAAYLDGAMAFYDGDFPGALRQFDALRLAEQPWVREASVYMVGRTWLNDAQTDAFDEWGTLTDTGADPGSLAVARAAFADYLAAYPTGRYAASATGLERRIDWLAKDDAALERAYGRLLADPSASAVSPADLANEIDNKLLSRLSSKDLEEPRLLFIASLMDLRSGALGPDLHARRDVFAETPALWDYLAEAAAFYGDGAEPQPAAVRADASVDYLAFSRETLRGLGFESREQWKDAESVWLGLLPRATRPLQRGQLELALGFNYEQSDRLDLVFADGSPVETPGVRSILLRYAAGPDLLRRQAKNTTVPQAERERALFTLLYKDLMRGHYGDFGSDVAMLPPNVGTETPEWAWPPDVGAMLPLFEWPGGAQEDYPCPPIREVAAALARNAQSPVGLNCLGEFILRNDLDDFLLDQQPPAGQLGSKPSPAWGKPYSRLDGYLQVLDDPKASPDDRAYALYRAVNCFGPSGYNGCGSQEIDVSVRRQWFRTLKGRYARTPWAERLKYYW